MSSVIDTCDLFNFDIGVYESYMNMDTPKFAFMSNLNDFEEPIDMMDFYNEVPKNMEPFSYLKLDNPINIGK